MDIYRVANHCPSGYLAAIVILWMRSAHIWQIEGVVNLLGSKCRIHRVDNHILIARLLNEHLFCSKQVALGLDSDEICAKGPLIALAALKGVEKYCLILIKALNIALICHKANLTNCAYSLGIKAVTHCLSHLADNLLAHTVEQKIGTAIDNLGQKNRTDGDN